MYYLKVDRFTVYSYNPTLLANALQLHSVMIPIRPASALYNLYLLYKVISVREGKSSHKV